MLVVGLLIGIPIALVGSQMVQTIYGCVPPANVQCNPSMPIIIIYGWILLVAGTATAVGSLWGIIRSIRSPHPEGSNAPLP